MRSHKTSNVKLFVGGTIPVEDYDYLRSVGVSEIFTADMPLEDVVRKLAESLA